MTEMFAIVGFMACVVFGLYLSFKLPIIIVEFWLYKRVVRCRDCKSYNNYRCGDEILNYIQISDKEYCSLGVRK